MMTRTTTRFATTTLALLSASACSQATEEVALSRQDVTTDSRANVDGYFISPTASTFKLPAGSISAASWQFTSATPASNWASPTFVAAGWQTGQTGFYGGGTRPGDVARTWWPDGASELWLRTTFTIAGSEIPNAMLWGRWDDKVEVYINGVLAATGQGWTSGYRYLGLTSAGRSALKGGTSNTIAVHVSDTGGDRYFDLGVALNATLTKRPATGTDRNGTVSVFGNAVKQYMIEHGIPAGVLAVMKKDQVIANWAFGWQDKAFTKTLPLNAVMRLASNDKVITRAAVRAVLDSKIKDPITRQLITADTRVFPLLKAHGLTPMAGVTVPANINTITIQHLFDHKSGIQELPEQNAFYADLGIVPGTSTPADDVRWVYSKDTLSTPGTQEAYSSSGYMVLRYLVQTVTNSYSLLDYLQNTLFNKVGSGDVFFASERLQSRQQSEPWYATLEAPYDRWINLENYTALSSTAQGMVRFLRRYHMALGTPLVDPITGGYLATPDNGWNQYNGGMSGTASYTIQRRWDEVSISVIFNISGVYDDLPAQLYDLVDTIPASGWGI